MVGTSPEQVELSLADGLLKCPPCGGVLAGWGHARERAVRGLAQRVRPRRARCSDCRATHVLLPESVLARRADCVAVIGAALVARAEGSGHRRIAVAGGVPDCTVRGWLRRFAALALVWRERFTGLLVALDPDPAPVRARGSAFADAVEVIGRAGAASVRRFGPRPPWQFASSVSGGMLLGPVAAGPGIG